MDGITDLRTVYFGPESATSRNITHNPSATRVAVEITPTYWTGRRFFENSEIKNDNTCLHTV